MSLPMERATPEEVAIAEGVAARRPRRTLFVDEAEQAKQNPGVWFKLQIVGIPGARQRAYQINKGVLTAFRPEGAFTALSSGYNHLLFKFNGADS